MKQSTIDHLLKVGFIVLLCLFVFILFKSNLDYYKEASDNIAKSLSAKDARIKAEIDGIVDTVAQMKKLKRQFGIIQEIKQPYFSMAMMYGKNGYAFTIVFAVTTLLTAVLSFIIVKKGWDNVTNFYLKSGFLVLFFFSTLFGVLQAVSNTRENTQKNISRYYFYNGLQVDLYDHIVDNPRYFELKQFAKIDTFLSIVNRQIKENPDIFFDIDIGKVPKTVKFFE